MIGVIIPIYKTEARRRLSNLAADVRTRPAQSPPSDREEKL